MLDSNIKIVFTDLDGTLLDSDSLCSKTNYETLKRLGDNGIIRVIATGRSLFSIHKVLQSDFPVDYIIFSSGAGIINWSRKRIIYSKSLEPDKVISISDILIKLNIDFMVHYPIPENHHFVYYSSGNENPDFYHRIDIYNDYAKPLDFSILTFGIACQLLAVIPQDEKLFEEINSLFNDVKVIRATSPLDHKSIWIEIFPESVSKGIGAKWLCEFLEIDKENSLGIGNDYNDIDLLNFTNYSCLVENSPSVLKKKFDVVPSNNQDGFSYSINKYDSHVKKS